MRIYINLLLLVLVFKSFVFLPGALEFYDSLPEDTKATAQIISMPSNRSILNPNQYRVYYYKK